MGRRFEFNFTTLSMEQITNMSNDEIQLNMSKLKRMIKESYAVDKNTKNLEVEYCYLDCERQSRQRHENLKSHKRY